MINLSIIPLGRIILTTSQSFSRVLPYNNWCMSTSKAAIYVAAVVCIVVLYWGSSAWSLSGRCPSVLMIWLNWRWRSGLVLMDVSFAWCLVSIGLLQLHIVQLLLDYLLLRQRKLCRSGIVSTWFSWKHGLLRICLLLVGSLLNRVILWCRTFRPRILLKLHSRNWGFASFLRILKFRRIDECLILAECCQLMIKVVAVEESLDWISAEHHGVLLELLVFLIFPVFVDVLLIKIIFFRRNKRRFQLLIKQILPWHFS